MYVCYLNILIERYCCVFLTVRSLLSRHVFSRLLTERVVLVNYNTGREKRGFFYRIFILVAL